MKFDMNVMPLEATPNLYVSTVSMVTMIVIVTVLTTVMIVTKIALVMNFYALGIVRTYIPTQIILERNMCHTTNNIFES